MNPIQTSPLCVLIKLGRHVNHMVTPIDFGGHSSKMKVTMGIIDKCGVRGDATLCVVIFVFTLQPDQYMGTLDYCFVYIISRQSERDI